ncbi:MAG: hypothetical protein H0V86_03025 [Chloroflexia bacterium]|nr:hypothetical protein [Chloroflexia bacterium]
MATTATGTTTDRSGRIPVSRILRAGLIAAVLAAIVNSVISQIARVILDAPDAFAPLRLPAVLLSTVGFILLGTVVFLGISRFARRPVQVFQIAAVIALLLSFSNPFFILNAESERFAGITGPIIAVLLLMHTAAAAITVTILSRTGRGQTR